MDFKLEFEEKKEKIEVKLQGELDIYSNVEFKMKTIKEYKKKKLDILLDCTELTYIDSTGLGSIIYLLNVLGEDGKKIYVRNLKDNLRKLFKITKLDELLIFEGEENE